MKLIKRTIIDDYLLFTCTFISFIITSAQGFWLYEGRAILGDLVCKKEE